MASASDEEGGPVMSDTDLETALEAMESNCESAEVAELLKAMNENRMISWEEAEQILSTSGPNPVVKSGLPESKRPDEPDNDTDVDSCTQRLLKNDPTLTTININNMKRTPIPNIQRMILAIKDNTHLKKLSLANTGLTDAAAQPLVEVIEHNCTLESINLETNYISGEFLSKFFTAALKNQTLLEVKAVNQGPTFSTIAEREIIEAINTNKGLSKVSINLRLPEGRHKIENAMLRNGEIKRIRRRNKVIEEELRRREEEEGHVETEPVSLPTSPTQKKPIIKADAKCVVKKVKTSQCGTLTNGGGVVVNGDLNCGHTPPGSPTSLKQKLPNPILNEQIIEHKKASLADHCYEGMDLSVAIPSSHLVQTTGALSSNSNLDSPTAFNTQMPGGSLASRVPRPSGLGQLGYPSGHCHSEQASPASSTGSSSSSARSARSRRMPVPKNFGKLDYQTQTLL